jgi:hypothetical protein
LFSPQQFGIWLDSSSPEQTVPYLWSEDTPASEFHPGPKAKKSLTPKINISPFKLFRKSNGHIGTHL